MRDSVPLLAKEELKEKLGNANLTVIDLRHPTQWAASPYKIAGAIFEDRDNVPAWAEKYPKDRTLVLYCAWTNEGTSARVARQLLDMGFQKVFALLGGWNEWEAAKFPLEEK